MRWPISPGHGAASRPAISFWNFTHFTTRPLLLVTGLSSCPGGPPHIAIELLYSWSAFAGFHLRALRFHLRASRFGGQVGGQVAATAGQVRKSRLGDTCG